MNKFKRFIGPLYAILIFVVTFSLGYYLGKNISYAYVSQTQLQNIYEIITIEETSVPINYILKKGAQKATDLCGRSTGLCHMEAGIIILDQVEVPLLIYVNFDNLEDKAINYFKIGDRKISGFVYLDRFEILADKYLIVTEPNNLTNNYIIHLYNYRGDELISYDATDNNSLYEIKNKNLYFYYCNKDDSIINENGQTLYDYTKYRVNSSSISKKIVETSEYQNCV